MLPFGQTSGIINLNYLLSSGEAEYKDSLDEAEKYMKDIKKAGLDSEVKKLIDRLVDK